MLYSLHRIEEAGTRACRTYARTMRRPAHLLTHGSLWLACDEEGYRHAVLAHPGIRHYAAFLPRKERTA